MSLIVNYSSLLPFGDCVEFPGSSGHPPILFYLLSQYQQNPNITNPYWLPLPQGCNSLWQCLYMQQSYHITLHPIVYPQNSAAPGHNALSTAMTILQYSPAFLWHIKGCNYARGLYPVGLFYWAM